MTAPLPIEVNASGPSRIGFDLGKDGGGAFLSVDLQVRIPIPELLEALISFQNNQLGAAAGAGVAENGGGAWTESTSSAAAAPNEAPLEDKSQSLVAASKARPAEAAGQQPSQNIPRGSEQWRSDDYQQQQYTNAYSQGGHFPAYPLPPGAQLMPQPSFSMWQGGWSPQPPPRGGQESPTPLMTLSGTDQGGRHQLQRRQVQGPTVDQPEVPWTPIAWLEKHTAEVRAVAWAPDGVQLATVSCDNTLCLWSMEGTPKVVATLTGNPAAQDRTRFTAIAWAPNSEKVITGSNDAMAQIWRSRSPTQWELVCTLRRHTKTVTGVCWSQDGTKVGTCSIDGSAIIWYEARKGSWKTLCTLRAAGTDVKGMAWSPCNNFIVTCGSDMLGRIWSPNSNADQLPEWKNVANLDGHMAEISSVAWSPDSTKIVTGSADHSACMWTVKVLLPGIPQGQSSAGNVMLDIGQPTLLRAHTAEIRAVAWSPQGNQIATSGQDKTARIWREIDPSQNKWALLATIREHSAVVLSVAWSPDGNMLVTGSGDNRAAIWQQAVDVLSL